MKTIYFFVLLCLIKLSLAQVISVDVCSSNAVDCCGFNQTTLFECYPHDEDETLMLFVYPGFYYPSGLYLFSSPFVNNLNPAVWNNHPLTWSTTNWPVYIEYTTEDMSPATMVGGQCLTKASSLEPAASTLTWFRIENPAKMTTQYNLLQMNFTVYCTTL